jgi:DNA-binding transcriptional regulator LsrR (DeoR family)
MINFLSDSSVIQISVAAVLSHDDYVGPSAQFINDIALVRLATSAIILKSSVKAICIPTDQSEVMEAVGVRNLEDGIDGHDLVAIGWGKVVHNSIGNLTVSQTTKLHL